MDTSTGAAFEPFPNDKKPQVISEDDVHLNTTQPPQSVPESRPNMIGCFYIFLYLLLFLTAFLVSLSTIMHTLSAARAILTGIVVFIALSHVPGPLSTTEAINRISSGSLSSLILSSLRTTLIGAVACSVCIGVVGGVLLSTSFLIKHGFRNSRYQVFRSQSGVAPSPEEPKNSNGGAGDSWKRIAHGTMALVAPTAVISAGVFTQRRWLHVSEDLNLIVQDPLRSAVVTLVGNVIARGLWSLWASWRRIGKKGDSPTAVGSDRAQEKLAIAVDDSSISTAPAPEIKDDDSPV